MKTTTYTKWYDIAQLKASPLAAARATDFAAPVNAGDILAEGSWNESVAPPSNGESTNLSYSFTVPQKTIINENGETELISMLASCSADLSVEDWGSVSVDGSNIIDLLEKGGNKGSLGGHSVWSGSGTKNCASGTHSISITGQNIIMPDPEGNQYVCSGSYKVVVLESGGQQPVSKCDECSGGTCDAGGERPTSRSLSSFRSSQFNSSSAGTSISASCDEERMYWSSNFGALRGLGGSINGKLEIVSAQLTSKLATIAALQFEHPLASYLSIPEEGLVQGARLEIINGARVIAIRYYNDGSTAPIGVDSSGGGIASVIEYAEEICLQWQDRTGAKYIYSGTNGQLKSYINPLGGNVENVTDYLISHRDATSDAITQIWSKWDGLVNIENISPSGYSIALYTCAQIASRDQKGLFILIAGAQPFKQFNIAYANESLIVTEITPNRPERVNSWTRSPEGAWSSTEGIGEDAITTTRSRNELEEGIGGTLAVWEIITEQSKGGVIASRSQDIYQSSPVGNIRLSHTSGYGSQEAQSTQYRYDGLGNNIAVDLPNGSSILYTYDSTGRMIREEQPTWAGDYYTTKHYNYANSSASKYNNDLSSTETWISKSTVGSTGILKNKESYSYSEINFIKRVETHGIASDSSHTQLSAEETWLGDAPNAHARGRIRMSQAINGVQTYYDYEANSLHGALYSVSQETRVNDEVVAGQSTRSIIYISSEGNTMREEQYALLPDGTWALTQGINHSYDVQNRRIASQNDNGRSSSRELICNGSILWAIDENGIRTDYAYDSARTLTEITRAASATNPESITEWIKDAAGRSIQTRKHIGAMSSTESALYDALGRQISQTDILGRITTSAYSADGLTSTVTTPSGATLINRNYTDGSSAEQSGTGQRHLSYTYDTSLGKMRDHTYIGKSNILIAYNTFDGFGEMLTSTQPLTSQGSYVFTNYEYNEKGQLTRQQTGSQAPVVISYDSMGNHSKQITVLDTVNPESPTSNRVSESRNSFEELEDGIYSIQSQTRYNAEGTALSSIQKSLISKLSSAIESKTITIDERGLTSTQSVRYTDNLMERITESTAPTSDSMTTATAVDGFTLSQIDQLGGSYTYTRIYSVTGITSSVTDSRGNTTISKADIAGRNIEQIDAVGNSTSMTYCPDCDQPDSITDALGNKVEYSYDIRGHKIAEYGTGIQPASYSYDDADRMTSLSTFRVNSGDIISDPTGRADGDITTWSFDDATGLELSKTNADATVQTQSYDAYNRLATITSAGSKVTTHSYNNSTGELLTVSYSDETPEKAYSYNFLGQVTSITDATATHNFTYNEYSQALDSSQEINASNFTLVELYDELGRSAGYRQKRDSENMQIIAQGYDTKGRIGGASFIEEGVNKDFHYSYLEGTSLLQTLSYPNGIKSVRKYEAKRNLVTDINEMRGASGVSLRGYSYDAIGRPETRKLERSGSVRDDNFEYNSHSELIASNHGNDNFTYDYDNIGNRKTAQELANEVTYDTNAVNQYRAIKNFVPEFDLDGNQTKLQTSAGIWTVVYNAENRPVTFTSEDGNTLIESAYDYMGRRAWKKVTENGTITKNERYLYRGYLQIAAINLRHSKLPALHFLIWDPTEAEATRPLALQAYDTWFTYGLDLSKNVKELFNTSGMIETSYDYLPFGEVSVQGSKKSPVQWSSEVYDEELGLVYYNYRHYNPADGRWINRDPIGIEGGLNLYGFVGNRVWINDYLGNLNTAFAGYNLDSMGFNTVYCHSVAVIDCTRDCPKGTKTRTNCSTGCCEYRTAITRENYTPTSNGCGAGFFSKLGASIISPRGPASFNDACNNHDKCYGSCGSDRHTCDKEFEAAMHKECRRAYQGIPKGKSRTVAISKCIAISASMTYESVNQYGNGPYQDAQDQACKWEKCY